MLIFSQVFILYLYWITRENSFSSRGVSSFELVLMRLLTRWKYNHYFLHEFMLILAAYLRCWSVNSGKRSWWEVLSSSFEHSNLYIMDYSLCIKRNWFRSESFALCWWIEWFVDLSSYLVIRLFLFDNWKHWLKSLKRVSIKSLDWRL